MWITCIIRLMPAIDVYAMKTLNMNAINETLTPMCCQVFFQRGSWLA